MFATELDTKELDNHKITQFKIIILIELIVHAA